MLPPKPIPAHRPEAIIRRELQTAKNPGRQKGQSPAADPAKVLVRTELCPIQGFTSWTECAVPINVLLIREPYADQPPRPVGVDDHAPGAEPPSPRNNTDCAPKLRNGTDC